MTGNDDRLEEQDAGGICPHKYKRFGKHEVDSVYVVEPESTSRSFSRQGVAQTLKYIL